MSGEGRGTGIAQHRGIAKASRERRQAEQEVQEGVRRREQFLAMLSHELRNPLAAILSATRILKRADWPDPSCQEAGHVVERQANHMTRLLDDLLDVSRITRGKIELRPERIELAGVAARAIEMASPLLEKKRQVLVVDIPPAGLEIENPRLESRAGIDWRRSG